MTAPGRFEERDAREFVARCRAFDDAANRVDELLTILKREREEGCIHDDAWKADTARHNYWQGKADGRREGIEEGRRGALSTIYGQS